MPYSRTNLNLCRLNFENGPISFRAVGEQHTDKQTYRHTYRHTHRQTDRQTEQNYYIDVQITSTIGFDLIICMLFVYFNWASVAIFCTLKSIPKGLLRNVNKNRDFTQVERNTFLL